MQTIEGYTDSLNAEAISGIAASQPKPTMATVAQISFHDVTMQETVEHIVNMVKSGKVGQYVCTGNLDHLLLLQKDNEFRSVYAQADLVVADGMPIVWLSKLTGDTPLRERVAGSDLFWHLAHISHQKNIRLFFLGGAPGSVEKATVEVRKRYPNVNICGVYCPPHERFGTPDEEAMIQEQVNAARPDILFVGFGAPKQEKWIVRNRPFLNVPVSIGVGGTFEIAGGIVKCAPGWVQRSGLEWLYRLAQNPRRLWRRYLAGDLPFFIRLCFATLLSSVNLSKNGTSLPIELPTGDIPSSQTPQVAIKRESQTSVSSLAR